MGVDRFDLGLGFLCGCLVVYRLILIYGFSVVCEGGGPYGTLVLTGTHGYRVQRVIDYTG